jgi:hypothetical protein
VLAWLSFLTYVQNGSTPVGGGERRDATSSPERTLLRLDPDNTGGSKRGITLESIAMDIHRSKRSEKVQAYMGDSNSRILSARTVSSDPVVIRL